MLELGPGQCWSYARPMLEFWQGNAGVRSRAKLELGPGQCWQCWNLGQGNAGVRARAMLELGPGQCWS